MKTLSLVMITKNEELKIRRCLESVKDFVNEIIVVDTGSIDKTKEIALEFGAKIFDYEWNNNFSDARNFAIRQSTGDWNLILDADEFISHIDLNTIYKTINSTSNFIGQIKILNTFEQDGEIRKSIDFISRFIPNQVYFKGSIHEQINSNYPRIKLPICIEHDGYLNTNKFDRNINLLLNEFKSNKNDLYLSYQIAKTYYSNKMYTEASYYFDNFFNNISFYNSNYIYDGIVLYLYNLTKLKDFKKGLNVIDSVFDDMKNCCDFYFICGVLFTEAVAYNTDKYINYFQYIDKCYINALNLSESNGFEIVEGTGNYLSAFNLGLFYELSKSQNLALKYYKIAASYGYMPAMNKLK